MPYCTQCGTQVQPTDQFCARCGARQGGAVRTVDIGANMTPRTASVLCYIPWVGWIAAIIVLASQTFRGNRTVRFHAFQGLYLFVAWLLVQVVAPHGLHLPIGLILQFGIIAVWVFMIIKTSQEQMFSLPVIGELAERSLSET